jgi:hypothetical protein
MFHFHNWVWDSQGAIYCIKCRKFKGWKLGTVEEYNSNNKKWIIAWGYLLNGEEWKRKKEEEIIKNNGKYF